jgi:hypothetical protein
MWFSSMFLLLSLLAPWEIHSGRPDIMPHPNPVVSGDDDHDPTTTETQEEEEMVAKV